MPAKQKQNEVRERESQPKRGRPCLLTPKRQAKLLAGIENGLPFKEAAMLAGLSYDTLNRWRIRGESKNAPRRFRHFCKALQRSQAIAMNVLVSGIKKKGKDDWKAYAWLLERRHPEIFGKPETERDASKEPPPIVSPYVNHPVLQAMRKQTHLVGVLAKLGSQLREIQNEEDERERKGLKPKRRMTAFEK